MTAGRLSLGPRRKKKTTKIKVENYDLLGHVIKDIDLQVNVLNFRQGHLEKKGGGGGGVLRSAD